MNFDGADGSGPVGLTQASARGRLLYGITESGGKNGAGTFFSVSLSGKERVYRSFRSIGGQTPNSPLVPLNGLFYGLTGSSTCGGAGGPCGLVFGVPLSGREQILHRFPPNRDGRAPRGAVPTNLTLLNGVLYGTADGGKKSCVPSAYYPCGMIFSVTTSGAFHILYQFKGPFPAGADGATPSSLVALNGTLYGMTAYGGSTGSGTVFSVTPGGKERVLYSFQGGSDGIIPISLTAFNGKLYGLTLGGNNSGICSYDALGCGTFFSVTTSGRHRVLYRFQGGSDAWRPVNALAVLNGKFYGTSQFGGDCAYCGTIFSITPGGRERVLYTFPRSYSKAGYYGSGLTPVKNRLYGTMPGGAYNDGVVYSFRP